MPRSHLYRVLIVADLRRSLNGGHFWVDRIGNNGGEGFPRLTRGNSVHFKSGVCFAVKLQDMWELHGASICRPFSPVSVDLF